MSAHRSLAKLKTLYEQQEVMCLVPDAPASLGWFVVVNEAEKKNVWI